MPAICYSGYGADDWDSEFTRSKDNKVRFYMLPPVKYPDGMVLFSFNFEQLDMKTATVFC